MTTDNVSSRIERLVRATPELVAELDLAKALQQVADLARDLLEARGSAVGILNPDLRTLASFTTSGMTDEDRERIGFPLTGRGVFGLVMQEGKVIRVPDHSAASTADAAPSTEPRLRSFLAVPITGREGAIGDLYLTEKIGATEFSDEDVHLAIMLAGIVASAVENVRYHERTIALLEEVQQLHRSRERFFAMVNHELRNSLAAVYGWAELMVRKRDPATVPRPALEILEAADQAVGLVNDLLDLNRLDEDRLRPEIREVDCGSLIQNAVKRVMPAAQDKAVTMVTPDREESNILCRTDAHRIEQILGHLLLNAIRYAPYASTVTIALARRLPYLEFQVRDQGPGIEPESVDRIFDVYYAVDHPQPGRTRGVGLPLSRRLARLLGGDLRAVSQRGQGGLLILSLPAVVAA